MGDENTGLEGIVDGYKGPVSRAKEWMHEKRWELTKVAFGSYLASKAYFGIHKILDEFDVLAQHPEKRDELLHEMIIKPAIENGWHDLYRGIGVAFLTYFALHHLGKGMSEQEINNAIEEWKVIHEGDIDKPSDAAVAVKSAVFGAALASVPYLISAATSGPAPSPLTAAYLAGAGVLGANYSLRYSHYLKSPKLKNMFELVSNSIDGVYHTLRKNYRALLRSTVQFANSFAPGMRKMRSSIADSLVKAGDLETAMELYRSEIENFGIVEKGTIVDAVAEPMAYFIDRFIGQDDDVAKAFRHLPSKPGKFLKDLGRAAEAKGSLDLKALNAIAHSQLSKDENKPSELWRNLIETLIKNPEYAQGFRAIDESAHKVMEFYPAEGSRFLRNVLIFKKGDKGGLSHEIEYTWRLKNLLGEGGMFKTPLPIGLVEHDGWVYVMQRNQGTRLSEIRTDKEKHYGSAAEFLALIHSLMPKDLRNAEPLKDLESGLSASSIFDSDMGRNLMAAYHRIFDDYEDLPKVFIKDSHGDNVIVGGDIGRSTFSLTAIDFDDKGIAYAGFDTAKLLEQGSVFPNNPEGNIQRYNALDRYIYAFNQNSGLNQSIPSREEFIFNHFRSVLLKAMSYYIFSLDKPTKETMRISFIQNMNHAIRTLENDFPEEYRKHGQEYAVIARTAESIPLSNEAIARTMS